MVVGSLDPVGLIVFDWDGTLSDSRDRIVECFQRALAGIGERAADEVTVRETIGLQLPDAAQVIMPGASRRRCLELTEAYRALWLAPGAPRAQLFDGALECLRRLREHGFTLTVATGKSRRGLDRELDETGLSDFFAATRTADETRGKPDPTMLYELLAEVGVGAAHALMVGDTTFDLEMARNAGVRAIAVDSGTHARERLQTLHPWTCVASVRELPEILGA